MFTHTHRHVALACGLGAAVTTLLALVFAPPLWPLGAAAGFATGYLAYEFREVVRAIPQAWKTAQSRCLELVTRLRHICSALLAWLQRPHPFVLYVVLAMSAGLVYALHSPYWNDPRLSDVDIAVFRVQIMHIFAAVPLTVACVCCGLNVIAIAICHEEYTALDRRALPLLRKLYFQNGTKSLSAAFLGDFIRARTPESMGIPQAIGWSFLHIGLAILSLLAQPLLALIFVVECLPGEFGAGVRALAKAAWTALQYAAKAIAFPFLCAWELVKLIHSNLRLLCGIDGAIGGMAAVLIARHVAPGPLPMAQVAFTVACGVALGVAWGLLNYDLVSVRLLKVAPARGSM